MMIEAFQALRDVLQPLFPDATISYVRGLHDSRSTRNVQSGVRIDLSVSDWKSDSKGLGQQGGARLWEVTIESTRLDSLENRWMAPSASHADGIYDVAKKIREALTGFLLSENSSPLMPSGARAIPSKQGVDLWHETFIEYLRPYTDEPEYAVSALSGGKLIVSSPIASTNYLIMEDTDGIETGEKVYGYLPDGSLAYIGTVSNVSISIIYFEENLAYLPSIVSRVFSLKNSQAIQPAPALKKTDSIHPEVIRTLSGDLIQSTIAQPSEKIERSYGPLTTAQLQVIKDQFNATVFTNTVMINHNNELRIEVYDQSFQEEPIGFGLWRLRCKGTRTRVYELDLWVPEGAPT